MRIALAWLLLFVAVAASGTEQIREYAIEIDVGSDGSLEVTEDITVRAEGDRIRRGIYRDFPTRYRDRRGNNVVVGFEVLGVERNGRAEAWFAEPMSNGVRVNTGGDDYLPALPGEYRYTLRYRTTRQIGFFAEHDELYWNAIGTAWTFPIAAGSVFVRLPVAVPVERIGVEGYTGPQGARGQHFTAIVPAAGTATWELTGPLAAGEGLTIVMTFPKGIVEAPTNWQRARWLLADNVSVLVALAGLAVLLIYGVRRWYRIGRDPRPGVIITRYEPPPGRAPAELRFLRRGRYDMRCFTSDLLTTAVAGQLVVECEPRRLRRDLWKLQRTTDGPREGPFATASTLLTTLLPTAGATLELENTQASAIQKACAAHTRALNTRLHGSHFNRNFGSVLVAAAITGMTALLIALIPDDGGLPFSLVILGLMVLVTVVFAGLIKAPTPAGRRLLDEAEGLQRYLTVAERDELAAMEQRGERPPLDAQRYESLLPFAIALEVEEAWTKKFTAAVGVAAAAAATAGMHWYRGGRIDDLGSFAKAVGSGLNNSIASASTPPGSSSGSGGGGSSGGGGGGGGGGGR